MTKRLNGLAVALCSTSMLAVAAPALAQSQEVQSTTSAASQAGTDPIRQSATPEAGISDDTIIVTARRVEENLQDVPISITVFNQAQLTQRNVTVASDLATYTPSLSANNRFGPEKSTFAIRGFNQDAASAPTVGVYFADVVGVRAQGGTAGGNTLGAGTFTDLQNVQILKGPQGTLFGRNTTGGAVLVVPQKPTSEFGGYLEGTYGNYDQRRVQAALNVPIRDTFKVRFSLDRMKRDGYMKNRSGVGPDDYNDVDYWYGRISIVADLTPNLENYMIAQYSRSDTNGYATHYESCDRNPASPLAGGNLTRYYTSLAACDQIDRQAARGDGPLDVEVSNPNPRIFLRTWQAINTTTWQASDMFTVKNIVSYGEYREKSAFQLYSDNFFIPNNAVTQFFAGRGGPRPGTPFDYIQLGTQPGFNAAAESTTTEELQLQGRSGDGKLDFVIGGYLEFSRPLGYNQQRTGIYGNCIDPGTLNCVGALPLVPLSAAVTAPGFIISESRTRLSFDNHGVFAQGTYRFTDQLSLTLGGRWTFDKIVGSSESNRYIFATIPGAGTTIPVQRVCNDSLNRGSVNLLTNGGNTAACRTRIVLKSDKPTWLIDVDYKPMDDLLLYAKYVRGYRQGAVNFTNPGLETVGPEKVDTYELGAKLTVRGSVPGYFNVAAFYNDFSNQQIFGALIVKPGAGLAGGAALINAGKSVIKGVEVDSAFTLFQMLRLGVGYTYLDSELKSLTPPVLDPASPFSQIIPRGFVGQPLTFSPKHRLTASADLTVPLGEDAGNFVLGGVYVYTSRQTVDGNARVPGFSLLTLTGGVTNIGGTGIDVIAFANNVTNKKYRITAGGGFESSGILDFSYAAPRFYGVRVRYKY